MLKRRVASGHLIPLHRGVYALGHAALRREGWWLAAVLACGPAAALSHRDAAVLHGLATWNGSRIDVSGPRTSGAAGIRHHRTTLAALDVETIEGIRATTVARTLVDLAGVLTRQRLQAVLSEADRQRRLDIHDLEGALQRTRGRRGRGHANLTQALADIRQTGPILTRSALEVAFLELVDDHGLPRPHTNAHVEGYEVDALWLTARVAVELDGRAFHDDARAFQRDRSKANALALAGWTVLRFTYADVTRRPHATAAAITRALGCARRPRSAARPG